MDPVQLMVKDIKLAGAIADNGQANGYNKPGFDTERYVVYPWVEVMSHYRGNYRIRKK
jgi:hypothetical protein